MLDEHHGVDFSSELNICGFAQRVATGLLSTTTVQTIELNILACHNMVLLYDQRTSNTLTVQTDATHLGSFSVNRIYRCASVGNFHAQPQKK